MDKITLYQLETPEINISMTLYFNDDNQLIFDGYDRGKKVKALKRSYDYEYYYTIEPDSVKKLYETLDISEDERQQLLISIKELFGGNEAYSKFGKFLRNHDIEYSSYSS